MSNSIPGLSDSDNTLLDSLISKEDKGKNDMEAAKASCGTQFLELADKLKDVAKSHPDAVAEFLARQPEFRGFSRSPMGSTTADDIKKFTPPNWDPGNQRGVAAAAEYLQAMRTKYCIDDIGRQHLPAPPDANSKGQSK